MKDNDTDEHKTIRKRLWANAALGALDRMPTTIQAATVADSLLKEFDARFRNDYVDLDDLQRALDNDNPNPLLWRKAGTLLTSGPFSIKESLDADGETFTLSVNKEVVDVFEELSDAKERAQALHNQAHKQALQQNAMNIKK